MRSHNQRVLRMRGVAPGRTIAQMSASAKILVGYDGSPASRAALAMAARHAGDDGTVLVVHAYEPPADALAGPRAQHALDARRAPAEALLEQAAADPALASTHVETDLLGDDPASAILAAAAAHDVDEIVIGSRGLGAVHAAIGSVGLRVLRGADRPVLVMPAAAAGDEPS